MSFSGPSSVSGQASSFYKAEVTKGILGSLLLSSCALHAPVFSSMKSHFIYSVNEIIDKGHLYKAITSKVVVFEFKDLVCSSLLFYTFRTFERRLGSRKFSSYLLNNLVISSILELVIISFLRNYNGSNIDYLPSGPTSLIFALFVKFMFEMASPSTPVLGLFPLSSKLMTYLIGIQLVVSSRSSFISALAGFTSGLLVNFIPFLNEFKSIPSFICDISSSIFSIIHSNPPDNGPILPGATLEIQRLQQTELLEQQIMMQSYNQMNRTPYAPILSPPPLPRTPPPLVPSRDMGSRGMGSRDIGGRDIGGRDMGIRSAGSRDSPPVVPPLPSGFSPTMRSMGARSSGQGARSSGQDVDPDTWSLSGIRNRRSGPYSLRPRAPSGENGNSFEQLIHDEMFGEPRVSFPPSPVLMNDSPVLMNDSPVLMNDSPVLMSDDGVSETTVEQLVEMGFDREQVIQALIQSNNDVNSATNLLLS